MCLIAKHFPFKQGFIHFPERREPTKFHFVHLDTVESRVLYGFRSFFCCLITFFVSAEGRRKDPEEFWSTSIVDRLKSDHEEALASQQETQMIFFIQQVAKNSKKKVQP